MKRNYYKLWLDYHLGKITDKDVTKEEYKEITTSDFEMHNLIPSKKLLKICNGYDNLKVIINNPIAISSLSKKFCVPVEVMYFKIQYLIQQKENIKKKILKKEKNLVYVNFHD